jgi:hypothetical protein
MERYELRAVELDEVINEIDRIWSGLQSDEGLQQDAKDAGIDPSKIDGMKRTDALRVTTAAHGLTGAELFEITAVSAVTGMHVVLYDLWKRVILPRVQQRFGKDAVKERAAPKDPRGTGSRSSRKLSRAADKDTTSSKKKARTSKKKAR